MKQLQLLVSLELAADHRFCGRPLDRGWWVLATGAEVGDLAIALLHYVAKTEFVAVLCDNVDDALFFTRLRRFGKALNLNTVGQTLAAAVVQARHICYADEVRPAGASSVHGYGFVFDSEQRWVRGVWG
ncbi:MAG: AAA family ATPase [Deltaproteobacteria bacterium]|nr:AAA family ATPase [Deltaproteobacteria bacterium]